MVRSREIGQIVYTSGAHGGFSSLAIQALLRSHAPTAAVFTLHIVPNQNDSCTSTLKCPRSAAVLATVTAY